VPHPKHGGQVLKKEHSQSQGVRSSGSERDCPGMPGEGAGTTRDECTDHLVAPVVGILSQGYGEVKDGKKLGDRAEAGIIWGP